MAKFINARCIHCLNNFDKITEDHIFPNAWYPKATSSSITKPKAPSCQECNKRLGKIEQDLMIRFSLGVHDGSFFASELRKKLVNSIDSRRGRDERDARARTSLLTKIISDLRPCPGFPFGIFHFCGHHHPPGTDGISIRIPGDYLQAFGEKVFRGLEYHLRSRFVEDDRWIYVSALKEDDITEIKQISIFKKLIKPVIKSIEYGFGFRVEYGIDPGCDDVAIYRVIFWNHWELWGCVSPKKK